MNDRRQGCPPSPSSVFWCLLADRCLAQFCKRIHCANVLSVVETEATVTASELAKAALELSSVDLGNHDRFWPIRRATMLQCALTTKQVGKRGLPPGQLTGHDEKKHCHREAYAPCIKHQPTTRSFVLKFLFGSAPVSHFVRLSDRLRFVHQAGVNMAAKHCDRCRHWKPVHDEEVYDMGQCRRFPPTYDGWPMTIGDDWCGEWQAIA